MKKIFQTNQERKSLIEYLLVFYQIFIFAKLVNCFGKGLDNIMEM